MATRSSGRGFASSWIALGILAATCVSPASAQFPTSLLNESTEVRSIRFRYLDSESFRRDRLLEQISLTQRGRAYGLRRFFSFLPFVSAPEPSLFDPLSMQWDVARIRAFYQAAGFPDANIRYEVALDRDRNLVNIEFRVREGVPRTLAAVSYLGTDDAPFDETLPRELQDEWRKFVDAESRQGGGPFGEADRAHLETAPLGWLMDRGYPFPTGRSTLEADASGSQVRMAVQLDPGRRRRVSSLGVEGAASVDDEVVLRQIPLRAGDWYSARRITEGRRRVFALDMFSQAVADVIPTEEPDSTVRILLRVREARPRSVSGFLGYTNVGGVTLGGEWKHRNLGRGARTLSVGASAQTGAAAVLTELPDQYVRGSVSLHQPFVFVPYLSAVASPFGEYRDDYRDRSWEAGFDGTLIYRFAPLQVVSLRYRLSHRQVLEYRLGDVDIAARALLGSDVLSSLLQDRVVVSVLSLSANLGRLDDQGNPRRGFFLQPNFELTFPPGVPTNEYARAELWGGVYQPLGRRLVLAGNIRVGRVFPFGASLPSSVDDALEKFLQLGDVTLTAGGPTDVRGWASRQLGPKIPDLDIAATEGDVTYTASRYLPLGGLARASGALELRFPLSGLASGLDGHVFLDGGRVWSPDDRYFSGEDPYDQDKAYYSTGAGVGIGTPVGPVRVSVGYKLNPSPLDLRDPADVLHALIQGGSVLDAPIRTRRRIQVHLTFGRPF